MLVRRVNRFTIRATAAVGATALCVAVMTASSAPVAFAAGTSVGTFNPVTPARILDTRVGNGAPTGPVGPKGVIHVQVAGRGGIPSSGVSAVVLNVTETGSTAGGYVTVYPTGVTRPTASNLNFKAATTRANSVTVSLGTGGQVDLYNNAGSTQLIADVTGYFIGDNSLPAGGDYQPVKPQRLADTRPTPVTAGNELTVPVDYGSAINPHIRALAVNITAVGPTAGGYLTAWSGAGSRPPTSTLNFAKGATTPNMAIIPTAPCAVSGCSGLPSITIYNGASGTTNVLVDITGLFDDGTLPGGMVFHPITPTRIADTRIGLGAPGALGAGKSASIAATGVVDSSTGALALNVTAVGPTASTYVTLWPSGVTMPTISTLNPAATQTVANAAIVTLGDARKFSVYNHAGTTNIVIDVAGTYETN
jgi:hypothetical protein